MICEQKMDDYAGIIFPARSMAGIRKTGGGTDSLDWEVLRGVVKNFAEKETVVW